MKTKDKIDSLYGMPSADVSEIYWGFFASEETTPRSYGKENFLVSKGRYDISMCLMMRGRKDVPEVFTRNPYLRNAWEYPDWFYGDLKEGMSLWIEPKCDIPRYLIRKKYKIALTPEKADLVVCKEFPVISTIKCALYASEDYDFNTGQWNTIFHEKKNPLVFVIKDTWLKDKNENNIDPEDLSKIGMTLAELLRFYPHLSGKKHLETMETEMQYRFSGAYSYEEALQTVCIWKGEVTYVENDKAALLPTMLGEGKKAARYDEVISSVIPSDLQPFTPEHTVSIYTLLSSYNKESIKLGLRALNGTDYKSCPRLTEWLLARADMNIREHDVSFPRETLFMLEKIGANPKNLRINALTHMTLEEKELARPCVEALLTKMAEDFALNNAALTKYDIMTDFKLKLI